MRNKFLCVIGFMLVALLVPVVVAASGPTYIRVGLTRDFGNVESVEVRNTRLTVGYGTDFGFLPAREVSSSVGFTVRMAGGQVVLQAGNEIVHTFTGLGGAQIQAHAGDFILLGSNSYRGIIEFRPSGGNITAINVISLEQYLYGVLPAEMPPSWHIEALKAQAVAARTFAFNRLGGGGHAASGFDICDSTHCQVYDGTAREHENTTRAVRETDGIMLFYGGRTILANYFSSSGGATDNSEDVWFEARPYLRSVNEIYEFEPLVWTRAFTWDELTYAASRAGANIGTVTGISVSAIGQASGRATELTLYGTGGTWSVSREPIRNFFGPIGGNLPSRNFTIAGGLPSTPMVFATDGIGSRSSPLNTFTVYNVHGGSGSVHMGYVFDGMTMRRVDFVPIIVSGGAGITINGRGWGHGVGMSQRGAEGMARLGFNFREILLHYYTGVEIRRG